LSQALGQKLRRLYLSIIGHYCAILGLCLELIWCFCHNISNILIYNSDSRNKWEQNGRITCAQQKKYHSEVTLSVVIRGSANVIIFSDPLITVAEKNKVGYWFRLFKGSYTLTGFLNERKRRREKKNSPLHPSFKDVEGDIEISLREKASTSLSPVRVKRTLKVRQEDFWNELLTFEGKYNRKMLLAFYYYWAADVKGTGQFRISPE
jgi:hypothetical protein